MKKCLIGVASIFIMLVCASCFPLNQANQTEPFYEMHILPDFDNINQNVNLTDRIEETGGTPIDSEDTIYMHDTVQGDFALSNIAKADTVNIHNEVHLAGETDTADAKNPDENRIGFRWQAAGIPLQNEGVLTWKVEQLMAKIYYDDRQNAAEGALGRVHYQYAVFASDKHLQRFDYPIKSGYYFNPAGVYSCTINTKQYIIEFTEGPTSKHGQLVDFVKMAFRYTSDLQYIDNVKQPPYSFNNSSNNGIGAISETNHKDRQLLSIDSHRSYQLHKQLYGLAYLLEETTFITFTVAPPSEQRLYTHVNMPNGDYSIKAYVEEFDFSFDNVNTAEMRRMDLDNITVTVSGSMYDDRNH